MWTICAEYRLAESKSRTQGLGKAESEVQVRNFRSPKMSVRCQIPGKLIKLGERLVILHFEHYVCEDSEVEYKHLSGGTPFQDIWMPKSLRTCRYGYPAFIAINPKERKYASLKEAFSYENARHFIESLRSVSLFHIEVLACLCH